MPNHLAVRIIVPRLPGSFIPSRKRMFSALQSGAVVSVILAMANTLFGVFSPDMRFNSLGDISVKFSGRKSKFSVAKTEVTSTSESSSSFTGLTPSTMNRPCFFRNFLSCKDRMNLISDAEMAKLGEVFAEC